MLFSVRVPNSRCVFQQRPNGEKQNGFSVLLQNATKSSQISLKELVEYFKESAFIEEEHHKHLSKLISKIASFGTVGSASPIWSTIRLNAEKSAQIHLNFSQKLQDVIKDAAKFTDEHQKCQKQLKENEAKTNEAVNLMQTTTTCLQKSKETYTSRCIEHEKLKRENAPSKEMTKSESKMKKSADEYRQYVEKYGKIRDLFEERMNTSCKNFQQFETNYLLQYKQLLINYTTTCQSFRALVDQAATEFNDQVLNLDVQELMAKFVDSKGTGSEKPAYLIFEEPDLTAISPKNEPINNGLENSNATNSALLPSPSVNLLDLSPQTPPPLPLIPNSGAAETDLTVLSGYSSNLVGVAQLAERRMFKSSSNIGGNSLKSSLTTPSPSTEDAPVVGNETGFLRKVIKKKKDATESGSFDASKSNEDAESTKRKSMSNSEYNALDEDDDQFSMKKFKTLKIKQKDEKSISASVDQLKDAVKELNFSNLTLKSSNRSTAAFGGPMRVSIGDRSFDESSTQKPPAKFLRAAKTGDDRFNVRLFAGGGFNDDFSSPLSNAGQQNVKNRKNLNF
uniref:F-BAR domain-containing protein n=1 Tax=Romanomermis culicivorax TaxID=13658 RepID=A0A915J8R4_ROMCU